MGEKVRAFAGIFRDATNPGLREGRETERSATANLWPRPAANAIGMALLVTDADGILRALDWEDYARRMKQLLHLHHGAVVLNEARAPSEMRSALSGYFRGDLDRLSTIKWRAAGTPFQHKVWTALAKIPAGTTMSYGALAARLGAPRAMRAVGHANGSNPISVVVPCHRLIGAGGSLVKYGGGLERKRWLLKHEGVKI
jgi:methylated-DNA-[protein]-cysteine S-methyltransferase